MKRVLLFFSIIISIFLVSCGSKTEQTYQEVKVNDLTIFVPKNSILVDTKEKTVNKFKILYEYKLNSFSGFADSILIGKYLGNYSQNEKKFFYIVMDKFIRKVAGGKIIKENDFSNGKSKIYYFVYSVQNSVFDDKASPAYYGLQAYIFNKPDVYVINILFANKDKIDFYINLLKKIEAK